MVQDTAAGGWGKYGLLMVGVFACATSVLMLKASQVHPVFLSSFRLLLAAALLTPAFWRAWRADPRPPVALAGRAGWGAALLAVHFVTWAAGARMTTAANGSLIVNMVPIVMPVLMYLMFREVISGRMIAGSLISLSGVGVLSVGGLRVGAESLPGDLMCFGSMVLVTGYLAVSRLRHDGGSLWLYVVPLYWMAGLMCLGLGLAWPGVGRVAAEGAQFWREATLIAGLAVVPTIVGHSLLNRAMRELPGQTVSIFNLAQFGFAGALGWALFGEIPGPRFYAAGALVLTGAIIVVTAPRTRLPPAEAERERRVPALAEE